MTHCPNPYGRQSVPRRRSTGKVVAIVLGSIVAFFVLVGGCVAAVSPSRPSSSAPPTVVAAPAAAPAPVEAPPVPASPATSFSDGTYEVGADIAAGRYKTSGAGDGSLDYCYWKRAKNDSGEFDSIISNDLFKGAGSVSVKAGEFLNVSGNCTWTRAS